MFTLESVKGRYIQSTLNLTQLTSSNAVTDSYFTSHSNLSKVIVKLKSVQGGQEILVTFKLPDNYDGSSNLTGSVYVSPSARDSFELAWVLIFDKQGGYFTVKASQLSAYSSDFAITFTSTEIDPNIPNGNMLLPDQSMVTPGSYENVTVDFLGRVVSGSNPTTLVGYGITDAVKNDGGVHSVQSGTNAERLALASPTEDSIFIALDSSIIYMYNNGSWLALSGDTTAITADIQSEISARQAADASLASSISTEASDRASAVSQEASARQAAVASLQSSIADEVSARSSGDSSTLASAQSYADQKIADLINSAPATLDTLKEIADQMANDESAVSALVSSLSSETSARLAGDAAEAADRQAADAGLQTQINSKASSLDLSNHSSASMDVHGVGGSVVGTSDVQTLTNKTIDALSNSLSNISNSNVSASAAIAHSKMAAVTASKALVSDTSGHTSASEISSSELLSLAGISSNVQNQLDSKASSASLSSHAAVSSSVHGVSGSVVGTSDVQTLTNKTIDAVSNTISNISNSSIKSGANIDFGKMEVMAASKAVVTDSSGVVSASSVSSTELGHLAGVTSPVQSQLDAISSDVSTNASNISSLSNTFNSVFTVNEFGELIADTDLNMSGFIIDNLGSAENDGMAANLGDVKSVLLTHSGASAGIHGALGGVVGTDNAQTLINKTIDASSNTISNITNTNISASANIAHNKMAVLGASKALVSDSSGVVSTSSVTSTELGYLSGVTSAIQTQLAAKANASDVPQEVTVTLDNSMSSATNISGLSLSSASYSAFILNYRIKRSTATASSEVVQVGTLRGIYNSQAASWSLSDDFAGQNAGVTFSMTAAGQIQYTSSNISGSSYAGSMKYYLKTFSA